VAEVELAAWQHPAERRQEHPVVRRELRPLHLAPQDRQLVPQHQDLQFLRALAAPEQHHQLQQSRHTTTYANDMAKKRPPKDGPPTLPRHHPRRAPVLSPIGFMHPTRFGSPGTSQGILNGRRHGHQVRFVIMRLVAVDPLNAGRQVTQTSTLLARQFRPVWGSSKAG